MKFLILILSLFVFHAHADTQAKAYAAEFSFNRGSGFQNYQLGTKVMRDQTHDAVAQYDFTKDGGAINASGISLRSPKSAGSGGGPKVILPKGALVIGCYIDVITALTTSASGTMALGTGATQVDLKAALAAASYTGIVACIPTGTAASAIKLAADSTVVATIATGAITAGKFNLHVQYVLSDE